MNGIAIRHAGAGIAAFLMAAGTAGATGAPGPLEAVDLGGVETRSAALMLSAQEAGNLDVAVAAIALPGEAAADAAPAGGAAGARARVLLVVDVGGASLLAGLPPSGAAASGPWITEIYAYALDAAGGLAGTLTRAFRLDPATAGEALAGGGVKFFGHLDLAPGEYSLRVLVQQRRSGRIGLEILPLAVPSWDDPAAPALLPPLPHESAEGWILVFEAGEPPPPFPLAIDGEPRVPATRWTVDADAGSGYLLLGRRLGGGLRAELLDETGASLELGMGDLRAVGGGPGGVDVVAAVLDTTGFDGGGYRLRISSAGGSEASSPVTIRPFEDAGLWESAQRAPPASGRRAGGPARDRAARAGSAYREALRAFQAQDRRAMLRPLVELERSEIGGGERGEQKRLGEAELQAAWEIAGGDAEGLLPILWIHGELYRQYHAHRHFQLATHSRRLLTRLAELYLERSASPEARHLVACALVGVAGYLHGIGALPAAEEAYRAVLDTEPDHPAGLIGLATLRESYGDYEAVARLLERLHAGGSADPQVGLRLGVNLRRLGKERRAEERLREIVDAPEPEWVAAVAAQELASLLAAQERWDEALGVLETALERHPDVHRLRFQMASVLDLTGRPAEARAVLEDLDPTAGHDVGSPRLRYGRMPLAELARARRTLAEETRRRLPLVLQADNDGRRVAPAG